MAGDTNRNQGDDNPQQRAQGATRYTFAHG